MSDEVVECKGTTWKPEVNLPGAAGAAHVGCCSLQHSPSWVPELFAGSESMGLTRSLASGKRRQCSSIFAALLRRNRHS